MKYKVIKSKEQYDQYCDILEQVLITTPHEDEIELLTLLIESWDRDHNSFDNVDSITLLWYLMNEHGLKVADLADIANVGNNLVSEILKSKRNISKGLATCLGLYFKIHEEAFIKYL